MRIQEIHPALVHFPITLIPTSLAADALGRLTNNQALMDVGRKTMPVAAASAAIAGVFGLVAQEAVNVEGEAAEMLITHRNLNLGLIGLAAVMAAKRSRRQRPTRGYLLAGAIGAAVMSYSAYLGGHMVYELGVGVKEAGGLLEGEAPMVQPGNLGEAARVSAQHIAEGARNTASQLGEGKVAPWLSESESDRPGA
ncbi:hypothetical protein BH23GEM6_BH23GEM6_13020 [soil metagenome]